MGAGKEIHTGTEFWGTKTMRAQQPSWRSGVSCLLFSDGYLLEVYGGELDIPARL